MAKLHYLANNYVMKINNEMLKMLVEKNNLDIYSHRDDSKGPRDDSKGPPDYKKCVFRRFSQKKLYHFTTTLFRGFVWKMLLESKALYFSQILQVFFKHSPPLCQHRMQH